MLISNIPLERTGQPTEVTMKLRDGQVALGKVNKIFPNNRAEVQIGAQRIVAQIDTPLAVGERYLFQVEQKGEHLFYLRVMGIHRQGAQEASIQALLQQMQIRATDQAVALVDMLLKERIPFHRTELIQALELLQQLGKSEKAPAVIKMMLQQRLPLSENVARALLTYDSSQITPMLKKALSQIEGLPKTASGEILASRIRSLLHSPTAIELPAQEGRHLLQMLQAFRLLSLPKGEQEALFQANLRSSSEPTLSNKEIFQLLQEQVSRPEIRSSILALVKNYPSVKTVSTNLVHAFQLIDRTTLPPEEMAKFQERVTRDLLPLLPERMQAQLSSVQSRAPAEAFQTLRAIVNSLANNHTYMLLLESLQDVEPKQRGASAFLVESFLLHAKQVGHSLGIANEAILRSQASQAEGLPPSIPILQETIKGLLLDLVHKERAALENVQQLVHYINGLQLQTKEEQSILQAQLQLPGERIGLPRDLFLRFEGKKTDDDQIDASFCRILFFLELHHIKETIIDMQVQKRRITLTVYNQFDQQLQKAVDPLKQALADGLESLDYHLSNLRFKPIEDEDKGFMNDKPKRPIATQRQEGFDIRI